MKAKSIYLFKTFIKYYRKLIKYVELTQIAHCQIDMFVPKNMRYINISTYKNVKS